MTIAQQSLDAAVKDLVDSVPEARAAAERAGLRIANEPTPTVETMEAEIEAARLVGHPLVDGIAALVLPAISTMSQIRRSSRPRWKR